MEQEQKILALAAWCRRQIETTSDPSIADALRKMAEELEKWAAELRRRKGEEDQT